MCVMKRKERREEVFVEVGGGRAAQRHEKIERIERRWRASSYTAGESECSPPSETVD